MSLVGTVEVNKARAEPSRWTEERVTKSLLGYLVLAGPLYVAVSLVQAVTRRGFDLGRDEWSLLENGRLGWIQMANLAVTGATVMAGSVGLGRALRHGGRSWPARLLGGYGVGLAAAGALRADPAGGFPPGAPAGRAASVSWHGLGHVVAGTVGFVCLIAACFVLARYFGRAGRRSLAVWSQAVGALFSVAFVGTATGSTSPAVNLAFTAAVIMASGWVAAIGLHFYRHPHGHTVTQPMQGSAR